MQILLTLFALGLTMVAGSLLSAVAGTFVMATISIALIWAPIGIRLPIGIFTANIATGFCYCGICYLLFKWLVGPMPAWAPIVGLVMVYNDVKGQRLLNAAWREGSDLDRAEFGPVPLAGVFRIVGLLVGLIAGSIFFTLSL
jgi:hypothetical protein